MNINWERTKQVQVLEQPLFKLGGFPQTQNSEQCLSCPKIQRSQTMEDQLEGTVAHC